MRKYLLPILLIWFWGCEDSESNVSDNDSNQPDFKIISGLWEWRYWYDSDESDWSIFTEGPTWWSLISEESYRERYLRFWDSDTLCYTDWTLVQDSMSIYSWELFGEDSATIIVNFGTEDTSDDNIVSLKAIEDSLIWSQFSSSGMSYLFAKAIRIDSLDFTPICDD